MPKRKKKSKKNDEFQMDFEIQFNDLTMIESNGDYKIVKQIMNNDEIGVHDWCIKSRLVINSDFGDCHFNLDFYHDGRVYILGYLPSPGGIITTDLGFLTKWCQENGWNIPQPIEYIVRDNLEVWKQLWNTLLVDSDYLDNRYGKRAALNIRDKIEEEDEDDDLSLSDRNLLTYRDRQKQTSEQNKKKDDKN